jgi:hypothetical protein
VLLTALRLQNLSLPVANAGSRHELQGIPFGIPTKVSGTKSRHKQSPGLRWRDPSGDFVEPLTKSYLYGHFYYGTMIYATLTWTKQCHRASIFRDRSSLYTASSIHFPPNERNPCPVPHSSQIGTPDSCSTGSCMRQTARTQWLCFREATRRRLSSCHLSVNF